MTNIPRWQGAALLALIAWLYGSILFHMVVQWRTDQDFSHGFLVPLFAFFVLWQNRKKLMQVKSSPSWSGLAIIIAGLLMLILGVSEPSCFSRVLPCFF